MRWGVRDRPLASPCLCDVCEHSRAQGGSFSLHHIAAEVCSHRDDIVERIFCFWQHASIPELAWHYPDHWQLLPRTTTTTPQPQPILGRRNNMSCERTSFHLVLLLGTRGRTTTTLPFFFASRKKAVRMERCHCGQASCMHAAVVRRRAGWFRERESESLVNRESPKRNL